MSKLAQPTPGTLKELPCTELTGAGFEHIVEGDCWSLQGVKGNW